MQDELTPVVVPHERPKGRLLKIIIAGAIALIALVLVWIFVVMPLLPVSRPDASLRLYNASDDFEQLVADYSGTFFDSDGAPLLQSGVQYDNAEGFLDRATSFKEGLASIRSIRNVSGVDVDIPSVAEDLSKVVTGMESNAALILKYSQAFGSDTPLIAISDPTSYPGLTSFAPNEYAQELLDDESQSEVAEAYVAANNLAANYLKWLNDTATQMNEHQCYRLSAQSDPVCSVLSDQEYRHKYLIDQAAYSAGELLLNNLTSLAEEAKTTQQRINSILEAMREEG